MRRTLLFVGAFLSVAGLGADPPAGAPAKSGDGVAPTPPSNNLPGPFHPYNVTGPNKGRFHCLVSQYGEEPVVLVFHRGLEASEAFRDLLKKLDDAIIKNPTVRLKCFVVFLDDDLPEVIGASDKTDDKREQLEKKILVLGNALKLNHVVLCLDGKSDVEKFNLPDKTDVTVLLYRKLRVLSSTSLPSDKVNEAAVQEILAAIGRKLGATRK
jgi:hypothetical protein